MHLSTSAARRPSVDYSLSTTTLVIPAGQSQASVQLTSLDDPLDEVSESIVIDLANITGGASNGSQQRMATISDDDDPPVVQLALFGQSVAENVGVVSVRVLLSAPSGQLISVPFTTSGTATSGSDYTLSTSPLIIPAGATAPRSR